MESIFRSILVAFLGAAVLNLSGCETMSTIDEGLAKTTRNSPSGPRFDFESRKQEIDNGNKNLEQFLNKERSQGVKLNAEAVGVPEYNRVRKIFDRVHSVLPSAYSQEKWQVWVVDNPAWNAFTTGGTGIVIYTGLLKDINDCELAYILGHESAHVVLGHISKDTTYQSIALISGKYHNYNNLHTFFTIGNEKQADQYGLLFATLGGYDPECAPKLWSRLTAEKGNEAGSYLSDHPFNSERAHDLSILSTNYRQYYAGDGAVNPNHEKIVQNILFPKPTGLTPGQGGGVFNVLNATLQAESDILAAKTQQANREALASTQQLLQQTLKLEGFSVVGNTVQAKFINSGYSRINDVFLLGIKIMDGQNPINKLVKVGFIIPPNGEIVVSFTDPTFSKIIINTSNTSFYIDSVLKIGY
ncbi:MAG: M48 family metallopeptidase [Sulfuriferula sp.]